jgi:hypothetical protein
MANFLAVEVNREPIGVDDSEPDPAVWVAAASARLLPSDSLGDGTRRLLARLIW